MTDTELCVGAKQFLGREVAALLRLDPLVPEPVDGVLLARQAADRHDPAESSETSESSGKIVFFWLHSGPAKSVGTSPCSLVIRKYQLNSPLPFCCGYSRAKVGMARKIRKVRKGRKDRHAP